MSKLCNRCGTENNEQYRFCKQCGSPLETETTVKDEYTYNANQQYNPQTSYIDGVSYKEMSAFVGKNSHKIIDKFSKMELADSKVSWCWPVAILSFFFGFFGAAFWFFYRKMYKAALIFVALGMVFNIIDLGLTFNSSINIIDDTYNMMTELQQSGDINGAISHFLDMLNNVSADGNFALVNLFNDIETLLSVVGMGMFSLHLYKNFAVKRIKNIKEQFLEENLYFYTLTARGGVSSGMVVLGVLIMYISSGIINIIPYMVYNFIK